MNAARRFLAGTSVVFLFAWASSAHAAQKLKDADCLTCHSDPTLTEDVNGSVVSIHVDENKLRHSHPWPLVLPVWIAIQNRRKSLVHESRPQKVTCSQCHADAGQAYAHSIHAKVDKSGKIPASCEDCHGDVHQVMGAGDPSSPINHANIPATCGRCHGQKFLMESTGESAQPFLSYQDSVHGRAVENGSQKAAVCTDCHGAHEILTAGDSRSPISKVNVPATCGKCHTDVANTFTQSIHGQAIARGNMMAPVCTDCHGIHSIKSHVNPNSPVAGSRTFFPRHLRSLSRSA